VFKENKITAIVRDSSAARNGLLIDHHMVEVNGQNVIGLKVKTQPLKTNTFIIVHVCDLFKNVIAKD